MKTAEEFLSHAEERIMLLKIFGYTPKEDQIKDLCKIMEQFRKEGMEEAYKKGSENTFYYEHGLQAYYQLSETFEEWYKENKEGCKHNVRISIDNNDLLYCEKCQTFFDKVVYEEWYNNQIKE